MNIIDNKAASLPYVPHRSGNAKQYIVVHYLGCVGQNNRIESNGCGAHFYIYYDGTVYQAADENAILWQVGTAGCYTQKHATARNANCIGIEMCVKCDGNASNGEDPTWYFTEDTQKACVELVQHLMRKHGIPASNVLRHYDVVNKTCPAPYVLNNKYKTNWTWSEFKARVSGQSAQTVNTSASGEKAIYEALKGLCGGNDYAAAGGMGNLYAESALRSTNLQNAFEKKLGMSDASYTAAVDSGSYQNFVHDGAGYGLAQWTYWSRKEALLKYARSCGKSIGDEAMQIAFLKKELQENYGGMVAQLKTCTSVRQASDLFLHKFEQPANQSEAVEVERSSYGQIYYKKYAGSSAGGYSEAVKEWQHAWNVGFDLYGSAALAEDGYFGPASTACAKAHLVYFGVQGCPTAVRWVQGKVGTMQDGLFGPATKAAVVAYQQAHGLSADGIVGLNTVKAILGQ